MGPGDRRDGQPLIFGWGGHLTRAQKQRYRERFVVAVGVFVVALVALVIGIGALQQFVLAPRAAVVSINGQTIQRQWYQKNLAYTQFVLQHQIQDIQTQYQSIVANQQANARATATANPKPSGAVAANGTPGTSAGANGRAAASAPAGSTSALAAAGTPGTGTSGTPGASARGAPSGAAGTSASGAASAGGTPAPSGTPTSTPTPQPTFNPQESATVSALTSQFATDQARLQAAQQQTMQNLVDADIMRQNATKFGISVSSGDVSTQAKKTTDQIGGDAALKQLFSTAHLSQNDFNQIQYDIALKDKFQSYFAANPSAAPTPSPTPVPSPKATAAPAEGPQPPTPTASPTPVPTPGADSLERWLQEQRSSAKITQTTFPIPSA